MGGKRLYREYDENGTLIKLECSKCGEIKSVDNFSKNKTSKDGIDNKCKECHSIYRKNHYLKNKNKTLIQSHEYYINNKEKVNERQHQYIIKNKQKILDYQQQHYAINKEKITKHQRQHYQENKEKIIKRQLQYYESKIYKEKFKIYKNVTKNLYPNNGIQYGIIYGVHCKVTDRWYIGQTRKSFNLRYSNNFFKRKFIELLGDNEKAHLLQYDIEKYGKENFEIFEVIDVGFSEKELDEKEVYYIDLYKAYDEGYNSNRGNIFKHEKSKRKDVI